MKVLVAGGSGYFGRILIQELVRFTDFHIRVGGRNRNNLERICREGDGSRLEPVILDLNRTETVEQALDGVSIAVCAAGPFQDMPLTLAASCLKRRIPYIDLADDTGFIQRVHGLVRESRLGDDIPAVCSGWSTIPALAGLMTGFAKEGLEAVDEINLHIAPGNRIPRSASTIAALLSAVKRPGTWSQRRIFDFPPPVGSRPGYVTDAGLDHFPDIFNAPRVACRVGLELSLLNSLFTLVARCIQSGGFLSSFNWAAWLRRGSLLLSFLGHDWGAVGVEVFGRKNGTAIRQVVSLIAEHLGHHIPVLPAVVMVEELLKGKAPRGLVTLSGWLSRERFEKECARRGYRMAHVMGRV